jgi:geranylgeranyl reductase family protein
MSHLDVAIVGGGPAGAWAARGLALAGAKVAVFDASHPREKPCGGGMTGRALRFLDEAGVRDRVPGVSIRTARFTSGTPNGSAAAVVPLAAPDDSPLVVVSRRVLDQALMDAAVAAGAEWRRERVRDLSVARDGVRLTTSTGSVAAGFVVGADGANSLVRRRLFTPFSRSQISIATGFYARGLTSTEVVVHCVADPPGYIWSFPRTDHAAIGICAQADVAGVTRLRDAVGDWMARCTRLDGAPLDFYSWPIPSLNPGDFRTERLAGPRWALVGDAAGLVDPLTREGIFFALQSGRVAAAALAMSQPEEEYAERVRDELYPELARAAALKARFFTSRFTDLLVEALQRSDKVRGIMADLVAGEQPYGTLKRRLLRTFEVGLAWRLIMLQLRHLP